MILGALRNIIDQRLMTSRLLKISSIYLRKVSEVAMENFQTLLIVACQ